MNIPEAETYALAQLQATSRQIHRIPQARRNPFGKIYSIYIFCSLVLTDPIKYARHLFMWIFISPSLSLIIYTVFTFRFQR